MSEERNLWRINQAKLEGLAMSGSDLPLQGIVNDLIEAGAFVQIESTKLERKLRDALNRILKLVPSIQRLQVLDRIAMELDAEAEMFDQLAISTYGDPEGLRADALFLRRLEYDLTSMREVKTSAMPKKKSTMGASSKYEPSQWPRGERP